MCQTCSQSHNAHINAVKRYDPTNTGLIRRRFEADATRRIKTLAREAYTYIIEDPEGLDFGVHTNAPRKKQPRYAFSTSSEKVEAFKRWLKRQEKKGLLEVQIGTRQGGNALWSDIYIESAYQKGVQSSGSNMRGGGVEVSERWIQDAFNRPIHADAVGLIYTRTYSDLEGISSAISSRLSGVLAQGVVEGIGSGALARRVAQEIPSIGLVRAKRLARTETVRAYSDSTLNAYEEAGMEGVEVLSELVTARDNKVCNICAALEGKVYTITKARGVLPIHPNCRCAWLPVIPSSARGLKLL